MAVSGSVTQFPVPGFSSYTIGFGGSLVRSSECCMLFHGFPAALITDPAQEKNADVAEFIAADTGIDSYVQHYRGLGRSTGEFSFTNSITASIDYVRRLKELYNYTRVHLIGHSWGAVVAMNVLEALGVEQIGNIILLSPFSSFPPRDVLRDVLRSVCEGIPIVFESGGIEGALNELEEIATKYHPGDIAERVATGKNRVTVIQATEDDEVPVDVTRTFVRRFKTKPVYIEFPSDHRFSIKRDEIYPLIAARIK